MLLFLFFTFSLMISLLSLTLTFVNQFYTYICEGQVSFSSISCFFFSIIFFFFFGKFVQFVFFNGYCVGQFYPVFQLCERKGPAQYSVWEETDIRGCPPEEWTKLPSEERWSTFVRNGAVSENDGHLGTSVRGAWRIC